MPRNIKPVEPFGPERHLDLQADLHFAFDWIIRGKMVLDVGAGLGKSKARIRHNIVTTHEPSEHCRGLVDICGPLVLAHAAPHQVVTAFEVLEHVEDDVGFLRSIDKLATEAIFLTTPNWDVTQCISRQHYREYTRAELMSLIVDVWPNRPAMLLEYRKDAEGGWVANPIETSLSTCLKHVVLIDKNMNSHDVQRAEMIMECPWEVYARGQL